MNVPLARQKSADTGYRIERRWFLKASAVLGLAGLLHPQIRGAATDAKPGGLDWQAFLDEAVPLAKEAFGNTPQQQNAYLHTLASVAARLGQTPDPKWAPFGTTGFFFHLAHRGSPFVVVQWRFDPGGYQLPHNHTDHSVCSVCLEGEARIRHYEIEGEAPAFDSDKAFSVRRTVELSLSPGRCSTLSSVRDNIHAFQAGSAGARGLDIISLHGPGGPSSFMELGEKPLNAGGGLFEATWAGIDPK